MTDVLCRPGGLLHNTAGVDVVQIPKAQPNIAVVAEEEGLEIDGLGLNRGKLCHKVTEEILVGAALHKRWESSLPVKGRHQAARRTNGPDKSSPGQGTELLPSVQQNCVVVEHRPRQLSSGDSQGIRAPARDGHQDRVTVKRLRKLLEQCGFTASLRADDGDPAAQIADPLRELGHARSRTSETQTLDAAAGKRVVSGPKREVGGAHGRTTSTGRGPIPMSRRSVLPPLSTTSSMDHIREMSLPEKE